MKTMLVFFACTAFLALSGKAFSGGAGACPATYTNWSTSWKDSGNYTKYKLKAPLEVFIGCPFDLTATVTDSRYPNHWVGSTWAIYDTYSSSGGKVRSTLMQGSVNGEPDNIWTQNGQWQRVITRTYTGTPYNHRLEFAFKDMGSSPYSSTSGTNWSGGIIGNVTLDPFLITLAPSLSFRVNQQNTTVIPASVFNPSGATLTYRWLEGGSVIQSSRPVDNDGNAPLYLALLPPLSVGPHTFLLETTDGTSTATAAIAITVQPPLYNVSVMNGWWLIPGILTGIGIFALRRQGKS